MVMTCGIPPIHTGSSHIILGDISLQIRAALDCLGLTLTAADMSFRHLINATVFLSNLALATAMNEFYSLYVSERCPARTTISCRLVVSL
ncbi:RidA family protein [Agrobacterium rosae]|uniref:RidA family protein n=1 Tax=Agrobacterium rosae TaxID=1972867 RepID=UPI003CC7F40A